MYTGKCVNCNCSTNLICQLSSQVMAILATHNHDNISFISSHMLKLSVARAVLVMGARGRGVTSHHNNLLHINTLTVTLQYVCWVFGHWRFWIIQNMSLLNYPHWCSLLIIEDSHECHKTSESTKPSGHVSVRHPVCLFFCYSPCDWHLSAPLCPRWEPPLTRDMGGECDNNSLVPITSGWHRDCGAMTDPTFEMVIGGALISEGGATCLCAPHQVIMVSW